MRGRTPALEDGTLKKRLWRYLPKLLTLFLLLLSVIPVSFPGYAGIRPCIVMIPVFYWVIFRPYSFSVYDAFLLGVILDFLDNTPAGINALTLLLFYLFTESQRRFLTAKPFVFIWTGFALLSFCAYFFKWFLTAINYARFSPFSLVFFSWLLSVLLYPLIAWICARVHLFLTEKEND